MAQYVLAVPNFSDGRRKEVIEAVVGQLRDVAGVKLLDYHPDPDFNRTMVTVIGRPDELKAALQYGSKIDRADQYGRAFRSAPARSARRTPSRSIRCGASAWAR